jgi:hypothetical protein
MVCYGILWSVVLHSRILSHVTARHGLAFFTVRHGIA